MTTTKFTDLGVIPGADLISIGVTPKELEIVKLTRWFKKGGNINYFSKGGAAKTIIKLLELFPELSKVKKVAKAKNAKKLSVKHATKKIADNQLDFLDELFTKRFATIEGNTVKLYAEVEGKSIELIGELNLRNLNDFLSPAYIKNLSNGKYKRVSRDLYDAAIYHYGIPLKSGENLLSPEKTEAIWKYFWDKTILGHYGERFDGHNGIVMSLNQPSLKINKIGDKIYFSEMPEKEKILKGPTEGILNNSKQTNAAATTQQEVLQREVTNSGFDSEEDFLDWLLYDKKGGSINKIIWK